MFKAGSFTVKLHLVKAGTAKRHLFKMVASKQKTSLCSKMGSDSINLHEVIHNVVHFRSQSPRHLCSLVQRQVQELPYELSIHDETVGIAELWHGLFDRSDTDINTIMQT